MNSYSENGVAPDILDISFSGPAFVFLVSLESTVTNFVDYYNDDSGSSSKTMANFFSICEKDLEREDCKRGIAALCNAGILSRTTVGFKPTCKLNLVFAKSDGIDRPIFICTDRPINNYSTRVFPWADEGQLLFSIYEREWLGDPPKNVLDIFSGAGTFSFMLALDSEATLVTGVDINSRAHEYARFNASLNGLSKRYQTVAQDLYLRNSNLDLHSEGEFDLIVIDPPFALMPPEINSYKHAGSIVENERLLKNAINSSLKLLAPEGVMIVITYALGGYEKSSCLKDVKKLIHEISPKSKITINSIEKPLWRIDGVKAIKINPMPVQYMSTRFLDQDWKAIFDEAGYSLSKYVEWIEKYLVEDRGYTHLHYLSVLIKNDSQ